MVKALIDFPNSFSFDEIACEARRKERGVVTSRTTVIREEEIGNVEEE